MFYDVDNHTTNVTMQS